ncbi:hypothetical protein TL16_g11785 [Triparma laevis f. inornata]|uniref:Kinesin light chain n=1 Tax=Triparma laevis f. inornata TaxID=1714386 RepID=A0A9W7BG54_9STRA|nr:hypothetical protein TL16_g11785 [Triparma laevis f. inornata]
MVEKKVRGKKKQKKKKKKNDPRKLEILGAVHALGKACGFVGDFDAGRRYYKRAKEGYEEQLGRDSEKALEATRDLIGSDGESVNEQIEKFRDLLKRCERTLGEENVVTVDMLNELGCELNETRNCEEAKVVWESCLAGRMKVLGEDHNDTFGTLHNLGSVYMDLKNYEKASEYYERALKGSERTLGMNHPQTIMAVASIASVYAIANDYGKAEELYKRSLEGREA